MSGYTYGETQPTQECPYCKTICDADFVDVGVGYTQCGPYHCVQCGASEIGPYDEARPLTEAEDKTGWYAPAAQPGSSANVIGGKVVSHRQMLATYRREFVGNPLWQDESYVGDWFKNLRDGGTP
jgi:hypothetical protein